MPHAEPDFVQKRATEDRTRLADMLVRTGHGEKSAFEELYRRTSGKLFGICLRIFPDRQEAEDALQDAYITIWNRAATFDPNRASPITWLAVVTRNRAIDRLRARGKLGFTSIDEAADVADSEPLADARLLADADAQALKTCLGGLDDKDALFIKSAFLRGATYAQLAERESVPLGTVKSRIRRALIKLRECMEE